MMGSMYTRPTMLHKQHIDDQGLIPAIASQIIFAQLRSKCAFLPLLLSCSSLPLLAPAEPFDAMKH